MGVMGQEKYEKVRDTINKQLRLEANPPIEDQESITENQGELLRKALLKLTGMNEAAMYPDGTISPEAKIKLANLDIQTIENTLLAPPDTTTVEPIKK